MSKCFITKEEIRNGEAVAGKEIRKGIFNLIRSEHSGFTEEDYISLDQLNIFRRKYLTTLILEERGELAAIDKDVMNAIQTYSILSENLQYELDSQLTFGQRLADRIASFGGSWYFIIVFFSFIMIWMAINVYWLGNRSFDPYPFILLNLILSCIAAIQAPVIMMSQNRQEQKDRQRSEHDYKINLKAELEIQLLNEKMDHLLIHQNKKLLEIQEVQTDYLEDLMKELKRKTTN